MGKTTNTYEDLMIEYESVLEVYEQDMVHKGLYCDGIVQIKKDLSCTEKACILCEEIGHYETSYGNILDLKMARCLKQETRARRWAHKRLIPIEKIVEAFENSCRNKFELAEFLNVTEEFLEESVSTYHRVYGSYTILNDYYCVYFEPLGIMKLL